MRRAVRVLASGFRGSLIATVAVGCLAVAPGDANANSKYSGIVVDAKTGKTLYSYKADTKRYPASLTKIMTLYMLFEELEAGRMSLRSPLKVSKYASSRPPSKLGLKPGSTIRAKDAILALVTKSANDVAVVVAENISGSVSAFGRRMTQRARQLGMKSTTFRNPSGLPNGAQVTTARDMALLGRAIQERFPKYYKYFGTRLYKYKGRRYGNHNRLLGRVKGVDGIKTGYIRASGFNLVTSVKRSNRHIVAVVMGGRTGASRNAQMKKLIASYLPKASRGKRTAPMLVARGASAIPRYAELRNIPVPNLKPLLVAEVPDAKPIIAATQLAQGNIVTGSIVPVPQKADLKAALRRKSLAFASRAGVPLPPAAAPRSRTEPVIRAVRTQAIQVASAGDAVALPKAPADASVTVAANNTADPEPGWQIQIAAAESEDGAIAMLKKAQGRTGRALRGYAPHTEPVEADGTTLYRARFIGFKTKTAAWDTCKTLKRNKFNCYAVYQ